MAAVVVNSQVRSVFGNRRVIMASINVAASGDTWATGLTAIDFVATEPQTAITHGATLSGGTVTFLNAADTAVRTIVIGI